MKKLYKRRGFTLMELLIVLVVVGILAAMMMVAFDEIESSARTAQVINDLRQLKNAVMAWYLENDGILTQSKNGYTIGGIADKTDASKEIHNVFKKNPSAIKDWLGNSSISLNEGAANYNKDFYTSVGGYGVYMGKNNTILMVVYRISDNTKKTDNKKLRAKLQAKAKTAGLLSYEQGKEPVAYNGGNFVFMQVFRTDK